MLHQLSSRPRLKIESLIKIRTFKNSSPRGDCTWLNRSDVHGRKRENAASIKLIRRGSLTILLRNFHPGPPYSGIVDGNINLRFRDDNNRRLKLLKTGVKNEVSMFLFVKLCFSMIEQYSWGHPTLPSGPTARTRVHSCCWTVEDYSVRIVETAKSFRKRSRWPEETSYSKLNSACITRPCQHLVSVTEI